MKINKILSTLSSNDLTSGKAFLKSVRELEEEKPLHFVAFVDEGKESWDVQVILDKKANVKTTACDCPSTSSMCSHIIAVLVSLNKEDIKPSPTSSTKKIVRKKRLTKTEKLLHDTDHNLLLSWLANELDNSKSLRISFEQALAPIKEVSLKELTNFHGECKKAVLGRRRLMTSRDAADIIKLLEPKHKTIILDQLVGKLHIKSNIAIVSCILQEISDLNNNLKTSTTRFITYLNKVQTWLEMTAGKTKPEALGEFLDMWRDRSILKNVGLVSSIKIISALQGVDDKKMSEMYAIVIDEETKSEYINLYLFKTILELTKDKPYRANTIKDLPLVSYENEYNIALIEGLIDVELIDLAEDKCKLIVERYHKNYVMPYLDILERIYILKDDYRNQAETIFKKFQVVPSLEFFYSVIRLCKTEEERNIYLEEFAGITVNTWQENSIEQATIKILANHLLGYHHKIISFIKKNHFWELITGDIKDGIVKNQKLEYARVLFYIADNDYYITDDFFEELESYISDNLSYSEFLHVLPSYVRSAKAREIIKIIQHQKVNE